MNLFIVESPKKIETIRKFLGGEFEIKASNGHIREIPKKGLGIDVQNNFQVEFQLIESKKRNSEEVLRLMKKADYVYFAQDLDREGELIAWHLFDEAKLEPHKVKRVVFNEITKKAVLQAVENPRQLNYDLIGAGLGRTVLDRLIGYKLSPLIWRRFVSDVPLSVGRVQTVALRIIVDRDREIESFVKEEFWNIKAEFAENFSADIVIPKNKKLTKEDCQEILEKLKSPRATIENIQEKEERRNPQAPFTTAVLQQEANTKLKISTKETMQIAQELYEGVSIAGENRALITYMRTDAVNLSEEAEISIRQYILQEYGKDYLPSKPCRYKSKTRNAQEAHEAIRPVYFDYPPEQVKPYLKPLQYQLYQLIWHKTIASQMKAARYAATAVNIDINQQTFFVKGRILKFDGFLKAYDDTDLDHGKTSAKKETDVILPPLSMGQELTVEKIVPEQKFSKPPPRYTESSLVKVLEKNGIGRPSTYANIVETLLKRNYVVLEKLKFESTPLGCNVCDWVRDNFELVVDIGFTAQVEDSLDEVAKGAMNWVDSVQNFYRPLREKIVEIQGFVEEELSSEDLVCELCGAELLVRSGKFGQFLGCSKYPECDYIKKPEKNRPEKKGVHGTGLFCEKCGAEFLRRESKFGPYFLCSNYPDCKNKKNRLSKTEALRYRCYLRELHL